MIKLVNDTITKEDNKALAEWLLTNPKLTKGELTVEFEEKFAQTFNRKYAVFVNSGSSGNLLMLYATKLQNPQYRRIGVPAVSWATTVSPVIQFGLEPVLLECDSETLGIDPEYLDNICRTESKPDAIIMTHILGFPSKINEIIDICTTYDIDILEDNCESMGSTYDNKQLGTIGNISTFSLYFGHHISTIEGGMVTTDDENTYNLLLMLRSHGWSRDLKEKFQEHYAQINGITKFKSQYTFYVPGFNVRSTDLQAFIGLRQLDYLPEIISKRYSNLLTYDREIKNDYWKIKLDRNLISNFAYPIIHPLRDRIVEELVKNYIECRPLVCGSMEFQPFIMKNNYSLKIVPGSAFADEVEHFGLYVPNNPDIKSKEVEEICRVINGVING